MSQTNKDTKTENDKDDASINLSASQLEQIYYYVKSLESNSSVVNEAKNDKESPEESETRWHNLEKSEKEPDSQKENEHK